MGSGPEVPISASHLESGGPGAQHAPHRLLLCALPQGAQLALPPKAPPPPPPGSPTSRLRFPPEQPPLAPDCSRLLPGATTHPGSPKRDPTAPLKTPRAPCPASSPGGTLQGPVSRGQPASPQAPASAWSGISPRLQAAGAPGCRVASLEGPASPTCRGLAGRWAGSDLLVSRDRGHGEPAAGWTPRP